LLLVSTTYSPIGRSWKRNSPALEVAVVWIMPVVIDVAVTGTFGKTAPVLAVAQDLIKPIGKAQQHP